MASPLRPNMVPECTDRNTSFPYRDLLPLRGEETMGKAASLALKKVDTCLGKLGNPVGIKSYKPFHSNGEDFLQTYLGMAGIPLDLVTEEKTEVKVTPARIFMGMQVAPENYTYTIKLPPHSFKAFAIN